MGSTGMLPWNLLSQTDPRSGSDPQLSDHKMNMADSPKIITNNWYGLKSGDACSHGKYPGDSLGLAGLGYQGHGIGILDFAQYESTGSFNERKEEPCNDECSPSQWQKLIFATRSSTKQSHYVHPSKSLFMKASPQRVYPTGIRVMPPAGGTAGQEHHPRMNFSEHLNSGANKRIEKIVADVWKRVDLNAQQSQLPQAHYQFGDACIRSIGENLLKRQNTLKEKNGTDVRSTDKKNTETHQECVQQTVRTVKQRRKHCPDTARGGLSTPLVITGSRQVVTLADRALVQWCLEKWEKLLEESDHCESTADMFLQCHR